MTAGLIRPVAAASTAARRALAFTTAPAAAESPSDAEIVAALPADARPGDTLTWTTPGGVEHRWALYAGSVLVRTTPDWRYVDTKPMDAAFQVGDVFTFEEAGTPYRYTINAAGAAVRVTAYPSMPPASQRILHGGTIDLGGPSAVEFALGNDAAGLPAATLGGVENTPYAEISVPNATNRRQLLRIALRGGLWARLSGLIRDGDGNAAALDVPPGASRSVELSGRADGGWDVRMGGFGPPSLLERDHSTVADMLIDAPRHHGGIATAASRLDDMGAGGGRFAYSATTPRGEADGGTIFDPSRAASLAAQTSGAASGTGCWHRMGASAIEPEMFGCQHPLVGTTTDHSPPINAAAAVARATSSRLVMGRHGDMQIRQQINLRGIDVEHTGKLWCVMSSIAIIAGGYYGQIHPGRQVFDGIILKSSTNTGPLLRVIGFGRGEMHIGRCSHIELYADSDDIRDSAIAYSKFYIGAGFRLDLSTNLTPADPALQQWINNCQFFFGGITHIRLQGTYRHNFNTFYSPTLETGSLTIESGWDNVFLGVRAEGGCAIHFSEARGADGHPLATRNDVQVPWRGSSGWYDELGVTVTGNTRTNTVSSGRTDLARATLAHVKSENVARHRGVAGVAVTGDRISSTGFVVVLETPRLPLDCSDLVFYIDAFDVASGGLRFFVDAFDANGAALSPDPQSKDVQSTSGFNAFGATVGTTTTITRFAFQILRPEAASIVIKVRSGGAGFDIRSLLLTAAFADHGVAAREMHSRDRDYLLPSTAP